MQIKRATTVVACGMISAFFLGCGGSKAKLDCAWLASNNCWKTTIAASASCLPSSSEVGTLSADGRSCSYASGKLISFDNPVVLQVPDGTPWKFTVTSGGQQCLRYEDTGPTSAKLTTSAGTVLQSTSGFSLDYTCPDGATYESSNAFDLLSCSSDAGLANLPGFFWSSNTNSVTFGLLGTSSGSVQIFNCQKN